VAARLYVLAGTNGAGKSSIGGAAIEAQGAEYFNPDDVARRIRARQPDLPAESANILAWNEGKRLLERAIAEGLAYAFETTLGGDTITGLLAQAMSAGHEVRIWYVGLESPELHLARVRARVARGGHDIPEARIRARYDASRRNLIRLMPGLTLLRVYDNSRDADPHSGAMPRPDLLLHMERGKVVATCDLTRVPEWAKAIVAVAHGS
jgi:predicted ABC-type ATPase